MKQLSVARLMRIMSLLNLIFFACFASVRAQTVIPFVCTEPYSESGATTLAQDASAGASGFRTSSQVPRFSRLIINPGGANEETRIAYGFALNDPQFVFLTHLGFTQPNLSYAHSAGEPIAFVYEGAKGHFGYNNTSGSNVNIARGPSNFFTPGASSLPGMPTTFLPGIHSRAVTVNSPPGTESLTWILDGARAKLTNDPALRCNTITYQGKLTQSGATANGNFDLQFTLYDAQTGGTPRSDVVTVNNVTVANGIFTVPLNFYTSLYNNYNARFLEISVRPAGSSVAFTVLTPRQPITDVPFAVNALNAVNTANLEGKTANQFLQISPTAPQTGSFNLSGDGRIGGNLGIVGNTSVGGNLTVSGTITSGCRSGFTAIAGGRLCVSAMQTAATFYGATGAIKTCANMQARVGNSADLMLTIGTTFDYRGGLQRGWLADHIGDNVWGTWINSSGETDFDDAPLNVYNGSNGSAPSLPYRCVY